MTGGLIALGLAGSAACAQPVRLPTSQVVGVKPVPRLPPGLIVDTSPMSPGLQCRAAIRHAEQAAGIPSQLMAAIGRVESGRRDASGMIHPWPWSINAEGADHVFETKAAAIAAVRDLQAHGVKSIDVGCMQVNLAFHPDAFASLEQAFDPVANAAYAARFLRQLRADTGSWEQATANYHSATPDLGIPYQQRVAAVWPEEQRHVGLTAGLAGGNVWSTNAWSSNVWTQHGDAWPTAPLGAIKPGGQQFAATSGTLLPGRLDRSGTAIGGVTAGRTLQAYRAAPIAVAGRPASQSPL